MTSGNAMNKKYTLLLLSYCVILSILIPFAIYFEQKKIIAVLLAPIILIFLLDNFDRYLKIGLMISMFIGFYLNAPYRIQMINLFSYVLILYFLINIRNNSFNSFRIPTSIKISSTLLIIAIFLSSINSPFASFKSFYYAVMFFIYIFTGYIIFRNIYEFNDIDNYFKYFVRICAIYGIFIIISIFVTGNLRARGITGTSFSDIIVCALLVLLFMYFLFEKRSPVHYVMAIILIIILVTDQSRFAWVGFLLSLAYGLTIVSIFQKSKFIKKKLVYLLSFSFLGIAIIFITGIDKLILQRFSDVSFSILQASEEKELISNSLDMRGLIWITALSAFISNPFTGVGYFMFYLVSENYNILPEFIYQDIVMGLDAHSTLLNFLCETGIIGFTAIITFFVIIFILSIKSIKISKSQSEQSRSLVLNILVFFIETTSIYSGDYTFGYNAYFLYFIFALVVSNYVLLKRRMQTTETLSISN
jgi:O-antigen ligase